MSEWTIVLKAAEAAARWHARQTKKGGAQDPYINHLLEVASLVAEATKGSDVSLPVAALLHDAIEDQEVPREMIAQEFGEDAIKLVEELTDNMALPQRRSAGSDKSSTPAGFLTEPRSSSSRTRSAI